MLIFQLLLNFQHMENFQLICIAIFMTKQTVLQNPNSESLDKIKIQKQPPEVFCEKRCSQKFHKIHRHGLFFNKVAGLSSATLLKKRLWHRCFPANFVKFLRTPFYEEHFWWLLLKIGNISNVKFSIMACKTSLLLLNK